MLAANIWLSGQEEGFMVGLFACSLVQTVGCSDARWWPAIAVPAKATVVMRVMTDKIARHIELSP